MRVAIIHDWLTGMRGGEKCLEVFCELWPDADVFTLIHVPTMVSDKIERMNIKTTFIQDFPRSPTHYRFYLPLFPTAIEKFDMRGYDLIISSSHCVAKGVRPEPSALHVCYCYTPMRYVWDMSHQYFNKPAFSGLSRWVIQFFLTYLRMWDYYSSDRVDRFCAISQHISGRIRKHYRREADVIYPPVDTDRFRVSDQKGDYYLIVSAFAPYKRIDLAVQAFNELDLPLIIVGIGQDRDRLMRVANKNIEFAGWLSDEELVDVYANCRAFIFPAEEDFGIAPLEAQASGKPVIAYGRGGVRETVKGLMLSGDYKQDEQNLKDEEYTGLFFREQTAKSIIDAVSFFEKVRNRFDPEVIASGVRRFDREVFKRTFQEFIQVQYEEHCNRLRQGATIGDERTFRTGASAFALGH